MRVPYRRVQYDILSIFRVRNSDRLQTATQITIHSPFIPSIIMLLKLNTILLYSLTAFFLSLMLYPAYIMLLRKLKAGKTIREETMDGHQTPIFSQLHGHKQGTPTMGGGLILAVLLFMVLLSIVIQKLGWINNSLFAREETYILLFALFSMGILGLIDDFLNIRGKKWIKGMTAKMKLIWMFGFSAFISYWFYGKLGVDWINFWPLTGEIHLGIWYAVLTFFFTITIVNAINITDGLDGLVGGLMLIILTVLWIVTFINQWFLATTLIGIVLGTLLAFLRFNINPAKIFMGDSGALALWWLIATLVYLLNIKFGIIIPFLVIFSIFRLEIGSSFLQLTRKKIFKRKLFTIAPYHHALEHRGTPEHTIVMKFWVVQGVLAAIALIGMLYQL